MSMPHTDVLADLPLGYVSERVSSALQIKNLTALLDVRDLLRQTRQEVLAKVPGSHPTALQLRDFNDRLTVEINRLNDAQARRLMEEVMQAVCAAYNLLAQRLPEPMRQALGAVEALVTRVANVKTYLQFSIQRICDGKPYAEVLQELKVQSEELATRYRSLLAEEAANAERLGQENAPRAKELQTNFFASMKRRDIDGAYRVLSDLRSENVRLGLLTHLGSAAKLEAFFSSAKKDLEFLVATEERRQMQEARYAPMRVIR